MKFKNYNGKKVNVELVDDPGLLSFYRPDVFDRGLRPKAVKVKKAWGYDFIGWEDVIGYRLSND